MRHPAIHNAYDMILRPEGYRNNQCSVFEYGQYTWVPARSHGYYSFKTRIKLAWGVFTGKYDALRWPGQEE